MSDNKETKQAPAENAAVRNKIAAALHYPDHWDTAAYPTLDDAAWEAIAAAKLTCSECGEWQSFPERDATKTNAEQGLYRKFEVRRVDGSDATGGKHDGCEYFVLDMTHDAHAPAALRAYAQACASTHPHLSADLMVRFGGERQGAALSEASVRQIAHRFGVLYDDRVTFYGDTLTDFIRAILAASAPTLGEQHTDDLAVDLFARAMKEKMAVARAKGRSGWEGMEPSELSRMLREHVEKGDPRDVANFCMMLWHHSAQIASQPRAAEPKGMTIEQIEKAALDFVKKPGMQGYVEPGDLIDFARALLAKGE